MIVVGGDTYIRGQGRIGQLGIGSPKLCGLNILPLFETPAKSAFP